MIIRKGTQVIAALISAAGTSLLPIASADTLSNGLTVTCTPVGANQITCVIGGCPRVNGDYVVDALHVMDNGYQFEYKDWKCINGATVTHNANIAVSTIGPNGYTWGFQGCRKNDTKSDWCTPYANYTWKPPAPAPAPAAPAPVPDSQKPVHCSAGYTLPPGSDCSKTPNPNPPPPPAPSIDVHVDQGFPNITFTVTNTSKSPQDLKCTYNAKKLSGVLGPQTTTKDFAVKAGPTPTVLQFLEIPKNTTYQVDISCTGQTGSTAYTHNFSA